MVEKSIHKRKSQSLVETGVFGVLILSAFTLLIAYIQKLDGEQYALMENFRVTLKKSHDENSITSYSTLNDKRVPDASVPSRERTLVSASGYTHWAVPQITEGDPQEDLDYSDHGRVTRYEDMDNDPQRKYYYYAYGDLQREHELSPDTDVSRVDRYYETTVERKVTQTYGNNEVPKTEGTVTEYMDYDLIGATVISQERITELGIKQDSGG